MRSVSVRELLDHSLNLCLTLLNNTADLNRTIHRIDLNRPGLALTGFFEHFAHDRVQIFGQGEHAYLFSLTNEQLRSTLSRFFGYDLLVLIFTHNNHPPEMLLEFARERRIPVFVTTYSTNKFLGLFANFLDEKLAPRTTIHGTLVEVFGVGILLQGKSGVGKSETALELVQRGHRLVADDVVEIICRDETRLYGSVSKTIEHHMEIRGLGIISVKELFGAGSVRASKRLDLIIQLEDWDENKEYDRLGIIETMEQILGVSISLMTLPLRPGRNVPVLIETAAKNHILKSMGHNAARSFNEKLQNIIKDKTESGKNSEYSI